MDARKPPPIPSSSSSEELEEDEEMAIESEEGSTGTEEYGHGKSVGSRCLPSMMCIGWMVFLLASIAGVFLLAMGSYCTLGLRSTLERCDPVEGDGDHLRFTWVYVNSYNICHAFFCVIGMIIFYSDTISSRRDTTIIGHPKGFRWGMDSGLVARDMLTIGCTMLMVCAISYEYAYNHPDWMLFVSEILGVITNTALSIYAKNVTVSGSRLFRRNASEDGYILLEKDNDTRSVDEEMGGASPYDPRSGEGSKTDIPPSITRPGSINDEGASKRVNLLWGKRPPNTSEPSNGTRPRPDVDHHDPHHRREMMNEIMLNSLPSVDAVPEEDAPFGVRWSHRTRRMRERIKDLVLLVCIAMMVHNACYLVYDFSAMSVRSFDPERSFFEKEVNRSLSWAIIYYRLIIFTYFYKKLFHKDKKKVY